MEVVKLIVIPKEVAEEGIQTLIKYVPSGVRKDAKKETAKRMKLRLEMIENREKMVR
jgi:hypothetical protein